MSLRKIEHNNETAIEMISERIFLIRGERVMIDRDLAELYVVTTKALNQAVKRNINRFPTDFIFQLNDDEKNELVTNCDRLSPLKHSSVNPYAFTEHGATMLAAVLNSPQAVEMSVFIVRAYIKMREMLGAQTKILRRVEELEKIVGGHDKTIVQIVEAIKQLMISETKPKKKIGFQ